MKTKTILTILNLLLAESKVLATNDDIVVKLPPELDMPAPKPLSQQERMQKELRDRVNDKLPYNNDASSSLGTLGQLVKLCDWVFIGKVLEDTDEKVKTSERKNVSSGRMNLVLSVETNLFGQVKSKEIVVSSYWWGGLHHPKKGDRMLVFLAQERYDKYVFEVMRFDFDKTHFEGETNNIPIVVRENRGMICLDGLETERLLLFAVDSYLQVLRREPRDADKYYGILRQLMCSPVQRIKEDAKSDLLKFLRSEPLFGLDQVLDDKNVDNGIKEYIKSFLVPMRQLKQNHNK